MAQWDAQIHERMRRAGVCTISVATSRRDARGDVVYQEFTLAPGETVVSDDPVTIRELNILTLGDAPVLAERAQRPAQPTHDLDRTARADRAGQ